MIRFPTHRCATWLGAAARAALVACFAAKAAIAPAAAQSQPAPPGPAPVQAAGPAGPTFTGRRGVGGIRTFGFPADRDRVKGTFAEKPYQPGWSQEMLAGRLAELKRAGFDFIRINVNPGPLLAADEAERERLAAEIEHAVATTVAAGISVLLDLHPSEAHPVWGAPHITAGPATPAFQRYVAVLRRLARIVSAHDPRRVAFEIFNEPPSPCRWRDRPDWPAQLALLHAEARRLLPRHTLVVAGACYAKIDGLLELDGRAFDANTTFTVHYYEPHIFTHQGYWAGSDKFLQYVAPLPWPAERALLDATLDVIRARITAARDLAPAVREAEWTKARRRVTEFFAEPTGTAAVAARFRDIETWARRHGVAPARILIGEFGVMKNIYGYTGALPSDRARWLADVRRSAEQAGFTWSVWALTNTMGIVTGDLAGPLDGEVLEALGLRRP